MTFSGLSNVRSFRFAQNVEVLWVACLCHCDLGLQPVTSSQARTIYLALLTLAFRSFNWTVWLLEAFAALWSHFTGYPKLSDIKAEWKPTAENRSVAAGRYPYGPYRNRASDARGICDFTDEIKFSKPCKQLKKKNMTRCNARFKDGDKLGAVWFCREP